MPSNDNLSAVVSDNSLKPTPAKIIFNFKLPSSTAISNLRPMIIPAQNHRISNISTNNLTPIKAKSSSMICRQLSLDDSQCTLDPNKNESLDEFHEKLAKWTIYVCKYCHITFYLNTANNSASCKRCTLIYGNKLAPLNTKKEKLSYFKSEDSMPGDIPYELHNFELSFVEEQLISLVCVNQFIYSRKGGSLATKGTF